MVFSEKWLHDAIESHAAKYGYPANLGRVLSVRVMQSEGFREVGGDCYHEAVEIEYCNEEA